MAKTNATTSQGKKDKRKAKRGSLSAYFALGRSQAELDFVDIDIYGDIPLFINPGALRTSDSEWAQKCVFVLQDFMSTVLQSVRAGDDERAWVLLSYLSEPRETHLGLSKGRSKGHGIAGGYAETILSALRQSSAGKSGLIKDLEDAALLVPGIGSDLISDITTNIIRGPLIEYTNENVAAYNIETSTTRDQLIWNADRHEWDALEVSLPLANGPLILVPKFVVRKRVDASYYFNDYLFEFIAERELENPNSEFIRVLKNGHKRVNRTELRGVYRKKIDYEDIITSDKQVYEKYKAAQALGPSMLMSQDELLEAIGEKPPDLDELLDSLRAIPTGNNHFDQYERAVDRLWAAMFSTVLRFPKRQQEMNDGRKRIDVRWVNDAREGFFSWVKTVCPAHYVLGECKNYGAEVGNPEFDQLAMRFGPSRGMFGFLMCRHLSNRERAFKRARDICQADRKYIIPIDDDSFKELVEAIKIGPDLVFAVLQEWFSQIAF